MSFLSTILTPPKSNYKDYYELAKFEVTWKMVVFISTSLAFLSVGYLVFDINSFLPTFYGLLSSLTLNVIFYYNKNYQLMGFIYVIYSILFLGVIMLFMTNILHIIEYVWLFIFTLYAFFILGNKVGFLVVAINVTFLTLYFMLVFETNMENVVGEVTSFQLLATVANLALGFVLIGFLVGEFKATRKHADERYKSIYLDVTEKNRLIEAQNEEKTIMLKEIHHRVKNNLQVVSSLIRLQSFETEDLEAKRMFDSTVGRVLAMALIHEKMYQKDNLSKINLADYFKSLGQDLLDSYGTTQKVAFSIESELEIIGNRTVVPLAFIFNELISNSLKHAFANVKEGTIQVSINMYDQDYFTIKYQDNGQWIKKIKDSTFGLELINTFTEQLDGKLNRVSDENGTTYTLRLKNIE